MPSENIFDAANRIHEALRTEDGQAYTDQGVKDSVQMAFIFIGKPGLLVEPEQNHPVVQPNTEPSDREKRLLALVRVVSDFVYPPAVPAHVLEEWRRNWLNEARELGAGPE